MLLGALEIINEWSFKNTGSLLIEDADPMLVDVNLANDILKGAAN
jgi:hypothetical protein